MPGRSSSSLVPPSISPAQTFLTYSSRLVSRNNAFAIQSLWWTPMPNVMTDTPQSTRRSIQAGEFKPALPLPALSWIRLSTDRWAILGNPPSNTLSDMGFRRTTRQLAHNPLPLPFPSSRRITIVTPSPRLSDPADSYSSGATPSQLITTIGALRDSPKILSRWHPLSYDLLDHLSANPPTVCLKALEPRSRS